MKKIVFGVIVVGALALAHPIYLSALGVAPAGPYHTGS
jgi:hypothetical protein